MTCDKCGHPSVDGRMPMPSPDPRRGMTADCTLCGKSIVYDTHHWETTREDGQKVHVCCACFSRTAPLTNYKLLEG